MAVCEGLEILSATPTIFEILAFPTSCWYQFYAGIMAAIFIVITMILQHNDEDDLRKPEMISSLGVSAIATIFLALIGTLLTIIQPDIFIEIFVVGMIFIVIWLLKR